MVQDSATVKAVRSLTSVLANKGSVTDQEALAMVRQLLGVVRRFHAAGKIHRCISLDTVLLNEAGNVGLAPSPALAELGSTRGSVETTPPELQLAEPLAVPADIEAARALLARERLELDPRRIDLYQIGAVLCRMLTGDSVSAYLHSPSAKDKVPPAVQPLLERALGYKVSDRFADCDEFLTALNQVAPDQTPLAGAATPSQGSPTLAEAIEAQAGCAATVRTPPAPLRDAPEKDLPFAQLGHYRILKRLGRGGMGDVYLGHEEALQRLVAVKVLREDLARNESFVQRFQAEASSAAKVTHPNVVPIFYIGKEGKTCFFAMQYVEGESLDRLLVRRGRLTIDEIVAILEQCLAGLSAAHQAGLIHRDIKPGNILFESKTGRVLVADFGLAKSMEAGASMTATGMIIGTVDYIAPEQALGQKVDARADLYALGVLAYQLLSGRLPFQAETPSAVLFQHAYEPPPPLSATALGAPATLAAAVEKLLAKDPNHRYQSCTEVLAALRDRQPTAPVAAATVDVDKQAPAPAARTSRIVSSTEIGKVPDVPLVFEEPAPPGWLSRWRSRGRALFQAHAPKFVQQLETTGQQVDGALAEYQKRRDRLARLVQEAQEAYEEMASQARDFRAEASAASRRAESAQEGSAVRGALQEQDKWAQSASELEQQAAEQQQQLSLIREEYAKADDTLGRLKKQRDALNARLRAAEAQLHSDGDRPKSRRRWLKAAALLPWWLWLAGGGGVLAVTLGIILFASQKAPTVPQGDIQTAQNDLAPKESIANVPPAPKPAEAIEPRREGTPSPKSAESAPVRNPPRAAGSVHQQQSLPGNPQEPVEIRRFDVRLGRLFCVAFAPGGKEIVCDGGNHLLVWDVKSGNRLFSLRGHQSGIFSVVYAADGRFIVTAGQDKTVRLWNAHTGKEERVFQGHEGEVHGVAISRDGKRILSGGGGVRFEGNRPIPFDSTVRLWDAATGAEIKRFDCQDFPVLSVALSPDGRYALACSSKIIHLWDVETGKEVRRFEGHTDTVRSVAISPDGRWILSGSQDKTLRLWDLQSGKEIPRFADDKRGMIFSVAFSPDGRHALAGYGSIKFVDNKAVGDDNSVRLWDVDSGREVRSLEGYSHFITCVAFSRDGRQALFGCDSSTMYLWDLTNNSAATNTRNVDPGHPDPGSNEKTGLKIEPADPVPVSNGPRKVLFQPVEFGWKASDGSAGPLQSFSGIMPAGEGVDLVWSHLNLYLMKTKGKLTRIWRTRDSNVSFKHLCHDGRYVWVPVQRQKQVPLLLVVDPVSAQVWEVTAEDGLPFSAPAEGFQQSFLMAGPVGPGKACIAGFSPGRVWLALATFDPNTGKTVKVFHQATDPIDQQDREQWKSTTVAFEPSFLFPLSEPPLAGTNITKRLLLGRSSQHQKIAQHPLLIDPAKQTLEAVRDAIRGSKAPDVEEFAYYQGAVYFIEPHPDHVSTEIQLARFGFPKLAKESALRRIPEGWLVFDKDRVHIVGKQWWTGTLTGQPLQPINSQLPWYFWNKYGASGGGGPIHVIGRDENRLVGIYRSSLYGLLVIATSNAKGPVIFQAEFQ